MIEHLKLIKELKKQREDIDSLNPTDTELIHIEALNKKIFELERKIKNAPCYKCEKRTEECHSSCEEYELYQEVRKDMLEKARRL